MKGVAKAFALGGTVSAFLFVCARFGVDMGFRARQAVADRRARRETQERTET